MTSYHTDLMMNTSGVNRHGECESEILKTPSITFLPGMASEHLMTAMHMKVSYFVDVVTSRP